MASYCMLCSKKLGFLSSYGEDILTGNTANKICEDCLNKAEVIFKKIEMKIPFSEEDFEGFSESGRKYIDEYLSSFGINESVIAEGGEISAPDLMNLEIGEATVSPNFEIDENETLEIFEKLKQMSDSEIEEFLEGIVSGNTADDFIREILVLKDDELSAVLSEQREFYNNAEWAYIMLVDMRRRAIAEPSEPNAIKEQELIPPEEINYAEIERMKEQYASLSAEELKEITGDSSYTYEARTAAQSLLAYK